MILREISSDPQAKLDLSTEQCESVEFLDLTLFNSSYNENDTPYHEDQTFATCDTLASFETVQESSENDKKTLESLLDVLNESELEVSTHEYYNTDVKENIGNSQDNSDVAALSLDRISYTEIKSSIQLEPNVYDSKQEESDEDDDAFNLYELGPPAEDEREKIEEYVMEALRSSDSMRENPDDCSLGQHTDNTNSLKMTNKMNPLIN